MPKPPRFLEKVLKGLLPQHDRESLPGDFAEYYHQLHMEGHAVKAKTWYLGQLLRLLPDWFRRRLRGQVMLMRQVVITSLRILKRQRLYMGITLVGMVLGISIGLATIGYIAYEFSFEDTHEYRDRIYRVNGRHFSPEGTHYSARIMAPMGEALKSTVPGVEAAACFRVLGDVDLNLGEKAFVPDSERPGHGYIHNGNCFMANSDFLKVFTLPLVAGDAGTALEAPFSVLITQSAAARYFGDTDAMGQDVTLGPGLPCTITGILKDIPENTQVHCDFVVSWETGRRLGQAEENWTALGSTYVYVKLAPEAARASVEAALPGVLMNHLPKEKAGEFELELQPLKKLYFDTFGSGRSGDLRPHGELSMIWTLGIIGASILLLAMLNFINLSTARGADRLKEVGLRKVIGAGRLQLLKQFLGETLIIMIVSLTVSIILYEAAKWHFTPMMVRPMFADFYNNPAFLWGTVGLVLGVTLAAGFYPAWVLARQQPAVILQKRSQGRSSKSVLRKTLVVFQFVIAIAFVATTALQYNQFHFLSSRPLGFKTDDILLLSLKDDHSAADVQRLKQAVLNTGQALSVSVMNTAPGQQSSYYYAYYKESTLTDESRVVGRGYVGDDSFLSTFGLSIKAGRSLSETRATDIGHSLLINESGAAALGIENPIGQQLYRKSGEVFTIVGVVRDFSGSRRFARSTNSYFISLDPEIGRTLAVTLPAGSSKQAAIETFRKVWNREIKDQLYTYTFLEDEVAKMYAGLKEPMAMMITFSIMTLFMAASGVLGLVAFTARQKTREIGIRKVMGAPVKSIVLLLGKEFIPLVLIAMAIAIPLAFLGAEDMLNDYAERAPIHPMLFVFIGLATLATALGAAAIQGLKAARANPIKAIQTE